MIIDDTLARSPETRYNYANFGVRLLAAILDFVVLVPLIGAITYFTTWNQNFVAVVVLTILAMAYKPLMEATFGATVGKMICKLKVIDGQGRKISGEESLIRYLPWLIGGLLGLYVNYRMFNLPGFSEVSGFTEMGMFMLREGSDILRIQQIQQALGFLPLLSALVMLFNKQRQSAHDILAKTYVVLKDQP